MTTYPGEHTALATSQKKGAAEASDGLRAGRVLRGLRLHDVPRALRPEVPVTLAPAAAAEVRPATAAEAANRPAQSQAPAAAVAAAEEAFQAGLARGRREGEAALRAELARASEVDHQAALERGLREGRERGTAEAREAARQQAARDAIEAKREEKEALEARLERLDQLTVAYREGLRARLEAGLDDMVSLSHEVVCRILGEHLVTRDGVAAQVSRAVEDLFGGGEGAHAANHLTVHVHPKDLELLEGEATSSTWLARGGAEGTAAPRWQVDERVGLGGCLVRSADGTLDARLETQFAALRRVLTAARGEDAPARPAPSGPDLTGAPRPAVGEASK